MAAPIKIRINLQPWRAQLRERKAKRFTMMSAVAFLIGVGIVVLGYLALEAMLEYHQSRLRYLNQEIAKLQEYDNKLKEIQKDASLVVQRINVIDQLQKGRSDRVRFLNVISAHLTDDMYFDSIKITQSQSEVKGSAFDRSVSDYMDQMVASNLFAKVDFVSLQLNNGNKKSPMGLDTDQIKSFVLNMMFKSSDTDNKKRN